MNRRNDPWDTRNSSDSLRSPIKDSDRGYNHLRQESATSVSDVMSQPQQLARDTFSHQDYAYQQNFHPQQGYDRDTPAYPTHMYTQDPTPTPMYNDVSYGGVTSHLDQPPHAQAHPGES
jgi:hypothetical protein